MKQGENLVLRLNLKQDDGTPLPVVQVRDLVIEVLRGNYSLVNWHYSSSMTSNISLSDGLAEAELLSYQSAKLKGLMDIKVTISYIDPAYPQSGAQTDVLVLKDQFEVENPNDAN